MVPHRLKRCSGAETLFVLSPGQQGKFPPNPFSREKQCFQRIQADSSSEGICRNSQVLSAWLSGESRSPSMQGSRNLGTKHLHGSKALLQIRSLITLLKKSQAFGKPTEVMQETSYTSFPPFQTTTPRLIATCTPGLLPRPLPLPTASSDCC